MSTRTRYGLIRGEGDVEFWEGLHSNKDNKVTKCYKAQ